MILRCFSTQDEKVYLNFYPCNRGAWTTIIPRIENDMSRIHFDDTVFDFYSKFIGWITDSLEQADGIAVIIAHDNEE